MTYLLEHRNPYGDHFYRTRNRPVLAIVVHVTAGLEDLDAEDDHSAERTAAYAAGTERSVSWHSGSDTDSAFDLLPASYTAFHCRGYNSSTYGHEISKRTTDWNAVSKRWRDRTLCQCAQHLAAKAVELGVPIRKATQLDLDVAITRYDRTGVAAPVGFLGHWELDPGRRSDPGLHNGRDTFPWDEFFDLVNLHANPSPVAPPPLSLEDLMSLSVDGRQLVTDTYEAAGRKTTDAGGRAYWTALLACADEPDERRNVINSLRDQLGLEAI